MRPSELAEAANGILKGNFGQHVIQFPSGKWGFVGTVPAHLVYDFPANCDVDQFMKDHHIDPRCAMKIHGVKTRAWDTKEAALEAAREKPLCAQCAANAQWNEMGGYKELAQECRDYCRNGHK